MDKTGCDDVRITYGVSKVKGISRDAVRGTPSPNCPTLVRGLLDVNIPVKGRTSSDVDGFVEVKGIVELEVRIGVVVSTILIVYSSLLT